MTGVISFKFRHTLNTTESNQGRLAITHEFNLNHARTYGQNSARTPLATASEATMEKKPGVEWSMDFGKVTIPGSIVKPGALFSRRIQVHFGAFFTKFQSPVGQRFRSET